MFGEHVLRIIREDASQKRKLHPSPVGLQGMGRSKVPATHPWKRYKAGLCSAPTIMIR